MTDPQPTGTPLEMAARDAFAEVEKWLRLGARDIIRGDELNETGGKIILRHVQPFFDAALAEANRRYGKRFRIAAAKEFKRLNDEHKLALAALKEETARAVDVAWKKWDDADCHESGCGCVAEWIKREIRALPDSPSTLGGSVRTDEARA